MATTTTKLDALAEQIRQRILQSKASVEKTTPTSPVPTESHRRQHYKFPLLLAAVASGVDAVALVGPAGTGKTSAAASVAAVLKRTFEATSFGPTTSKADLFGFIDAHGVYRETGLVRAAKDGGVFLGDELDAGHAGVVTGLNMVLANGHFGSPGGMIEKHADFVPIFGMNTYGTGANRQYVGRNQLDAASLDRMAVIDWDLDAGLEAEMVGIEGIDSPSFDLGEGGVLDAKVWIARVWTVRRAIELLGIRAIVSPRCTQNGVRLFRAGVGRKHVEEMVLWKGMDADTRTRVEAKVTEITQ